MTPASITRSETRGRPPLRPTFVFGNSGATTSHSVSGTSRFRACIVFQITNRSGGQVLGSVLRADPKTETRGRGPG
jgi:hypothetical protein